MVNFDTFMLLLCEHGFVFLDGESGEGSFFPRLFNVSPLSASRDLRSHPHLMMLFDPRQAFRRFFSVAETFFFPLAFGPPPFIAFPFRSTRCTVETSGHIVVISGAVFPFEFVFSLFFLPPPFFFFESDQVFFFPFPPRSRLGYRRRGSSISVAGLR